MADNDVVRLCVPNGFASREVSGMRGGPYPTEPGAVIEVQQVDVPKLLAMGFVHAADQ